MSRVEFSLAVAVLGLVGYLVLPSRLRAEIRREVKRCVRSIEQEKQLARAEREHPGLVSRHT